jgi:hypothetical protein
VDIDLAPLESFDVDGVIPDVVEDEDYEDIYVEVVFDASPPTQQRKRTLNYTDLEDIFLVRACENVSLDAVTGTDQTDKRYCQHIEDRFYHNLAIASLLITSNRTARSFQGRWDVIKFCCSRWSGCLEQVQNAPASGITIDDYVSALCASYFV